MLAHFIKLTIMSVYSYFNKRKILFICPG